MKNDQELEVADILNYEFNAIYNNLYYIKMKSWFSKYNWNILIYILSSVAIEEWYELKDKDQSKDTSL